MGDTTQDSTKAAQDFITRWSGKAASELSTAQSFVNELCALLGVAPPTHELDYMFERSITFRHGDGSSSAGRIDCYRRGHFVLEAKKLKAGATTKGFDDAMLRARAQAENYARALPVSEGRPPFCVVVDVGNIIELYSEFSRSGATYTPFPDPRSHRIKLTDLTRPEVQATLRAIWTEPDSLDPARASARVTREVAAQLADLARSLEHSGHRADHVGAFLTRCLFSMFAEDVELLPKGSFLNLLQTWREQPATLQQMLRILWSDMDHGGFSAALAAPVMHFNGKLFKEPSSDGYSLLLNQEQIDLLITAARANWREVEPAIFGTLLERALDPTERHALGAHYTPRAYVERLVLPTVVEPLRADWANAQAASIVLAQEAAEMESNPPVAKGGKDSASFDRKQLQKDQEAMRRHENAVRSKWDEAYAEVARFHHQLCTLRVLDPACGSGNFLYVTLEHLKRLEGEVLNHLTALGHAESFIADGQETVTLQQLRGIEINERAAALAELVLWIGFLQWHIRTRGNTAVAEPVVHNYGNIECRDAVLAWDDREPAYDAHGVLLTRWDGKTFKTHPVTGAQVPADAAQVPQWKYLNARQAAWPQVDFVVGNPPFIGKLKLREALGDGYIEALRSVSHDVPDSADFVMYWWAHAAKLVATHQIRRMGLITTNSLTMVYNRRLVEWAQAAGTHLHFAIADHPWVDSANGAAVRIAMTVLASGEGEGTLFAVANEETGEHGEISVSLTRRIGLIHADLSVGANVAKAEQLAANQGMSHMGVILVGSGFIIQPGDPLLEMEPGPIRQYMNGRDLTQTSRGVFVIDLAGLTQEEARSRYPHCYQRLYDTVRLERSVSRDPYLRDNWWLFRRTNMQLRSGLARLKRYIGTTETAKHRTFSFIDGAVLPDQKIRVVTSDDAFYLGVLSSSIHVNWALATGGTLEDRPVYNNTICFETFPFPDTDTGLTPNLRSRIASLAEQIDAHRKKVLGQPGAAGADLASEAPLRPQPLPAAPAPSATPTPTKTAKDLTLTGLYNVLEALREGRELTPKERQIHAQGLVGVLKDLHDELDAAVLQAYGWSDLSADATDTPELLERLVALNALRVAEEKTGTVRWLRPEFQNPAAPLQPGTLQNQELPMEEARGLQVDLALSIPENDAKPRKGVAATAPVAVQAWPATLPEQVRAVAAVLAGANAALTLAALEAHFKGRGPWKKSLPRILETLEALGRARHEGDAWRG